MKTTRSRLRRRLLRVVAAVSALLAAGLLTAGCNGGTDTPLEPSPPAEEPLPQDTGATEEPLPEEEPIPGEEELEP